ncbi:MAG: hypothetical protein JST55_05965 [Bacteroidetes bacterium]|nr:hypothetical protein [Bacteroidota bacterium]
MKYFFVFAALIIANFCHSQSDNPVLNNEEYSNITVQNSNKNDSALSGIISLNTPAVFSITFYDGNKKALISSNKYTSYDGIYLDKIEGGYLSFRKKYPYKDHPNAITTNRRIALKDIKSLGYSTDSKETFGAVLGAGIGFAAGTIIGILSKTVDDKQLDPKFSPGTISSIAHPILAFGGTGLLLGYFIGGKMNGYESFDLSKFNDDNDKKISEINRIVKEGLNYKRKK